MTLYSLLEWYCIRNKYGMRLIDGKATCYFDRCILTILKTPFHSGRFTFYGLIYYPDRKWCKNYYMRFEDFKYIYNKLKEEYDRANNKGDV